MHYFPNIIFLVQFGLLPVIISSFLSEQRISILGAKLARISKFFDQSLYTRARLEFHASSTRQGTKSWHFYSTITSSVSSNHIKKALPIVLKKSKVVKVLFSFCRWFTRAACTGRTGEEDWYTYHDDVRTQESIGIIVVPSMYNYQFQFAIFIGKLFWTCFISIRVVDESLITFVVICLVIISEWHPFIVSWIVVVLVNRVLSDMSVN